MKKILLSALLIVVIILILFLSYPKDKDMVVLAISNVSISNGDSLKEGVVLTPRFKKKPNKFQLHDDAEENLIYEWKTTNGEFLGMGQSMYTENDNPVTVFNNTDSSSLEENLCEIELKVIGIESKKVYASTALKVIFKDDTFEIVQ